MAKYSDKKLSKKDDKRTNNIANILQSMYTGPDPEQRADAPESMVAPSRVNEYNQLMFQEMGLPPEAFQQMTSYKNYLIMHAMNALGEYGQQQKQIEDWLRAGIHKRSTPP